MELFILIIEKKCVCVCSKKSDFGQRKEWGQKKLFIKGANKTKVKRKKKRLFENMKHKSRKH